MGAGINLFKQLFPLDYYSFQTAMLISSKPTSKVVVGTNIWNEEYEAGFFNTTTGEDYNFGSQIRSKNLIPVFPNTTYFADTEFNFPSGSGLWLMFYDVSNNVIPLSEISYSGVKSGNSILVTNNAFTTPARASACKFYTTSEYGSSYLHDISINYPSTDHDYHAYEEHTYPLGGDELRGLLIVENGNLVAFGDIHNSDGTGTLYFEERAYQSGDESLPNAITDGTNTVVALTTPTPTTYTPFTNPMISGSTEEFTDTRSVKMFVGHDSLYYSSPFKGW